MLKRPDGEIYYEEYGQGFPILCFAPGGARSNIEFWHRGREGAGYKADANYCDPTLDFAKEFRVIVMDQRNAGKSWAKVTRDQGWHTYNEDQIALMDHLRIERFHVMGMCIGGPFDLLMCEQYPERVTSAVLWQTIGRSPHNGGSSEIFEGWSKEVIAAQPDVKMEDLVANRDRMYRRDFVYAVSREFVKACQTPLFVLAGNDLPHPQQVSEEVAALAPNCEYWGPEWKKDLAAQRQRISAFLKKHTPN
jgi:pimeloyl-ACP methyl ester carboxylesterase